MTEKTSPKEQKESKATIRSAPDRYRLSVYRSNKHLYTQIIDDNQGKTLVSVSDIELKSKISTKKENDSFKQIGVILAKKAIGKNIQKVHFDRGQFTYHGQIEKLATG